MELNLRSRDPIYREVVCRSRRWDKIKLYEEKVSLAQERKHIIQDEREFEVLHWLLEGKSYRWIGMHMGLSFSHIKRIRDSIVEKQMARMFQIARMAQMERNCRKKNARQDGPEN